MTEPKPGAFAQFKTGFAFFREGVRTVVSQPRLWPYVFMPALITLTSLVIAVMLSWSAMDLLTASLFTPAPGSSALWSAFLWFCVWSVRIGLLVVCSLAAYLAASLIAVPFNDKLSNEVEIEVLGPYSEDSDWRVLIGDLLMSLRHTVLGLALWLVCMVGLALLNLFPGIGSIIGTIGSVVVSSLLLSRETMDGCMSRRRLSFKHKLAVVRANMWMCVGLGFGAWLVMWIPGMNFLVLPMAVAGGTRMFCWLELSDQVPNAQGTGPLRVGRHAA